MTNQGLARFFTAEFIVWGLSGVIAISLSYGALANKVEEIELERRQDAEEIQEIRKDVSTIQADVAVVRSGQGFFKDQISEISHKQDKLSDDLSKIRGLLERNYKDER